MKALEDMRSMKKIIVSLAALLMTGSAFAMPVFNSALRDVLVGDNRGVTHGVGSPYNGQGSYNDAITIPLPPIDPYAQQNSTMDVANGLFSGSGLVGVNPSPQNASGIFAHTIYNVSFDLDTDYNYVLTGSLQVNSDGGIATALFDVSGPVSFLLQAPPFFGVTDLTSSGILSAGTYSLVVLADMGPDPQGAPDGFYAGFAEFNFNLSLTAREGGQVPVASPLALIAIGLLATFLTRRKRLDAQQTVI